MENRNNRKARLLSGGRYIKRPSTGVKKVERRTEKEIIQSGGQREFGQERVTGFLDSTSPAVPAISYDMMDVP